MTPSRFLLGASVASLSLLVAIVACDLNPQPLPPGEEPDGALTSAPGSGDNGGSGGGGSSGGAAAADASAPPVVAADGGAVVVGEDAATGVTDAGPDGASDAESDAAAEVDAESADAALDASDQG